MYKKLRKMALFHQGLTKQYPFGRGKDTSKKTLEHLGYVQIDTLAVVERAHHHTLWSRIPNYQSNNLNQLVRERSAFEYWSHAASYLPMRDYRFSLPKMLSIKRGESRHYKNIDNKHLTYIYDRIRIDGPQQARNFESNSDKNGKWWDWKPSKRALEKLFMQGDLMVTERKGMEKVYDLTDRVLPDNIDLSEPSPLEFAEYLLNTSIRANGFTSLKQLTHLRPGIPLRKNIFSVLQQKIQEGIITEINIDNQAAIYASSESLDSKTTIKPENLKFLSPFDNAIIHRERVEQLFNFYFRLECYLPADKRRFGYFCLPILYGELLVGRIDCKAHRKTGVLEIIHLHLEKTIKDIDHFLFHFAKTAYDFAKFNQCHSLELKTMTPQKLQNVFQRELSNYIQAQND